jgi:transcriptional regulator with XRE-family HTH domain
MKSSKVIEIQNAFKDLLSFKSKEDRVQHHEHMLVMRLLSEIEKLMDTEGINKKELAQKLDTSASYVTQLFRTDKIINLHTLAKIEVEFNKTFAVKLIDEVGAVTFEDLDEDEIISRLNRKSLNEGRWVYHRHKTLPTISSSEYDAGTQLDKALGQ